MTHLHDTEKSRDLERVHLGNIGRVNATAVFFKRRVPYRCAQSAS